MVGNDAGVLLLKRKGIASVMSSRSLSSYRLASGLSSTPRRSQSGLKMKASKRRGGAMMFTNIQCIALGFIATDSDYHPAASWSENDMPGSQSVSTADLHIPCGRFDCAS